MKLMRILAVLMLAGGLAACDLSDLETAAAPADSGSGGWTPAGLEPQDQSSQATCRSERDSNNMRYYLCDQPTGGDCRSERDPEGGRYYICRQAGNARIENAGRGGGDYSRCRSERDSNNLRYYICPEAVASNCRSERDPEGGRYFICR